MDRHTARYIYEHRLLPHWFFDLKEKLVASLIKNPNLLYEMLCGTFEQNGVFCPYSPRQFSAIAGRFTDTVTVIKLTFPEPEEDPLCYAAFLFFDSDFENLCYLTVERTSGGDGGHPHMYAFEKGKKHMEVGPCELGGMKDFQCAAEYYMNRFYSADIS